MSPLPHRTKYGILGGVAVATVIILYGCAVHYGFFYMFWWYDSVLHIFGGVGIAFLCLAKNLQVKPVFWVTFAIGVLWEIFERLGHVVLPRYLGYGGTGDTLLDIVCAILGASAVILITRSHD